MSTGAAQWRGFRFGVEVVPGASRREWRDQARRIEDLGYDRLQVPDHIGVPAPFPTLMAVADVVDIGLGTYVLNAGFYRPAMLAREAETVARLSGGRLELGLGAGYVREDFDAVGMSFPTAGRRVDHLEDTVGYLGQHVPDVPVLIAGSGDRVLRLAARRSSVVGLMGGTPGKSADDVLADRVHVVKDAAGERFDALTLNSLILGLPHGHGGAVDLEYPRRVHPDIAEEDLRLLPSVLSGTVRDIADTIRHRRDAYDITYYTVQERHAEFFAKVVAELR